MNTETYFLTAELAELYRDAERSRDLPSSSAFLRHRAARVRGEIRASMQEKRRERAA